MLRLKMRWIVSRNAAQDVQRAFTPGAAPNFGDVATDRATSRAVLDPLSVAPPPDAYFLTTDERGRSAYTRDGGFVLRTERWSAPAVALSSVSLERRGDKRTPCRCGR